MIERIVNKRKRQKFVWTDKQKDKLNNILVIIEDLKEYAPFTLRQIYYQLVGKSIIPNNPSQYNMLSELIKFARIDGLILWNIIEDRTRAEYDLSGYYDKDNFIDASVKYFLTGYKRDLLQTQDKYIEIWIEKNAISSIITRIAGKYTIRVQVTANNSVSRLGEYAERIKEHHLQQPVILYFGDFDPSGVDMLPAMKQTLEEEMKIFGISYKPIALNPDQVRKYNLPIDPDAIKSKDKRTKGFKKKYGSEAYAVELDALQPDVLQEILETAILNEIDRDKFYAEREIEESEFDILNRLKKTILNYLKSC